MSKLYKHFYICYASTSASGIPRFYDLEDFWEDSKPNPTMDEIRQRVRERTNMQDVTIVNVIRLDPNGRLP